jgi:integrase
MPRRTNDDAPKTGYGNGGVHEEKVGSNRWVAELDGIRRRARSEAAANEKLRLLQERRDARLNLKKGSTRLIEWLAIWLAEYCDHLKPLTRSGYTEAIKNYIEPYPLAKVRMEDLASDDIDRWMKTLRRKGLAEGTIAIAFRRLRKALKVAKQKDYIDHNPAEDVEPPDATPTRDPVILEPDQIMQFLQAWEGFRLFALYAIVVTLGLRRGELMGLRWQDINLETRTMMIRGQLQWVRPAPEKKPAPLWVGFTKGRKRKHERIIESFPPELADALKTWRKTQAAERLRLGKEWHGGDYVFTTAKGGPLFPRNLYRGFKAALKRANLPETMTFHDLRHCAGSMMLERGEDIEAVREVLGHSSRSVTERIYAHALRSRKQKAGASLGYLLRRTQ